MRITHQLTTRHAIQNMGEQLERLSQMQTRASGKAFQTVSDQPDAASEALKLRSKLQALGGYQNTSAEAKEWLEANEGAFQSLENLATRAIETVTRGLNDTVSASDRAGVLAGQIDSLLAQAIADGNTTHKDQFIFAGFQTGDQPFTQIDPNTVNYAGDQNSIRVRISPNENMAVNFDGSALLSPFFNRLIEARNALSNNDMTALGSALTNLQGSLTTIAEAHAENGMRARQAQSASGRLEDSILEVKSMLSQREDVDLAEAISLLRNQETTYQAVLEVSQRAISALNLFEHLR